jgi:hypothetical protein
VRADGDYRQHLLRLAAALIPPLTVSHDTPEVRAVLEDLLTDDAAGDTLADLLRRRGDPRAESVRELVGTPWAKPKRAPRRGKSILMARGSWFVLQCEGEKDPQLVVVEPTPGTWQYRQCVKTDGITDMSILRSSTREAFGAAVAQVRRRMIYRLLETDDGYVADRREILAEGRVSVVARRLLDQEAQRWVPLARELRVEAPGRYEELCHYMLTRPRYQELYLALFDAGRADGRARLVGGAR